MYKIESLLFSNGTLKWSHINVTHPISNRWSPYIKWRYQISNRWSPYIKWRYQISNRWSPYIKWRYQICINYQRKKQKDYYYQWGQIIITIWRHFLDEFNEQSWPLSFENWIFTFEPMQPVLITRKVVNYVPTSGEASLIEKKMYEMKFVSQLRQFCPSSNFTGSFNAASILLKY